jgi:glyoxylase-like metal-dependent hydrolase (beta-lactamase superfamily II)
MLTQQLPTSEHFELHQLSHGVYAAIAIPGGAAYSNAGIIDLGERTLLFDTFDNPKAAVDLKAVAEQLTGRPASHVVISHSHPDHWLGNQVFAEHAAIITTHEARAQMLSFAEEIRAVQMNLAELQDTLQQDRARLEVEPDERMRASLRMAIARGQHNLDALPNLELHFPDQTFTGRLVFHGTRRTAELITQGKGHTASDCYLLLLADKVAFIGDLGFFACQPFMPYADLPAWLALLDGMTQWDVETFVPGHGPLGTKADLVLQKQYMRSLDELIGRVIAAGGSVDDALEKPLPAPFDAWLMGGMRRWEANVRALFDTVREIQAGVHD